MVQDNEIKAQYVELGLYFSQDIVTIRIMEKSVLNIIKNTYDLTKDEDVLALYADLQAGKYQLVTREEMAFDDEIYERAMEIKQRRSQNIKTSSSDSSGKTGKNKKGSKKVVVLTKREWKMKRVVTGCLFFAAAACLCYFGYYCYEAYRTTRENERLASRKENVVEFLIK